MFKQVNYDHIKNKKNLDTDNTIEGKHFSDIIRKLNPDIESKFKIILNVFQSSFDIYDNYSGLTRTISYCNYIFLSSFQLKFKDYFDFRLYDCKSEDMLKIFNSNISNNCNKQINNIIIILEFMLMTIDFFNNYILHKYAIKVADPENRMILEKDIKKFIDEVLNYKIIHNSQNHRIELIRKNPLIEKIVVNEKDESIQYDILKYNHHSLKGNLEEKKKILSNILSHNEPFVNNESKKDNDVDLLKIMFNNCDFYKHKNKPDEEYKNPNSIGFTKNFSEKEQEEIYNRIYILFIYLKGNYDIKEEFGNSFEEAKNYLKNKNFRKKLFEKENNKI